MPMSSEKIQQWRAHRDELKKIAEFIASRLSREEQFVLWLRGELGVGKTTFAGELLHALSLPQNVPVLSPTFTFMTEYETKIGTIAHLDIYRLTDNQDDPLGFLLADRNFSGLIVEWPERAKDSPWIKKTHELELSFTDNPEERIIILSNEK